MSTAQTVLTGGNQTAQVQAITSTVPWIAVVIGVVLIAMVLFGGRKRR